MHESVRLKGEKHLLGQGYVILVLQLKMSVFLTPFFLKLAQGITSKNVEMFLCGVCKVPFCSVLENKTKNEPKKPPKKQKNPSCFHHL